MVSYTCSVCLAEFIRKSSYDRHINRKTPCYPFKQLKAENNDLDLQCGFCDDVFGCRSALKRHINKKHAKEIIDNYNEKRKNDINADNSAIVNNDINHSTVTNSTNCHNVTNKIKINVYGEENKDFAHNTWKRILNEGFTSPTFLTRLIHFNKKRPENHNMFISNLRSKYVHVYTKTGWEVRESKDFIDDLLVDKEITIFDIFEEMLENGQLNNFIIRKMRSYELNQDQEDVKKRRKEELKLLLYNKRKLPMQIKKAMETM